MQTNSLQTTLTSIRFRAASTLVFLILFTKWKLKYGAKIIHCDAFDRVKKIWILRVSGKGVRLNVIRRICAITVQFANL